MQEKLKYYQTLGIQPTDDEKIIKKAYRKLAFKYHPDRNDSPNAHVRFIEITRAYEILSGQIDLPSSQIYPTKTREEIIAEKVRMAKERYQQQMEEEARKDREYFQRVAHGWRWKFFTLCAVYTTFFTICLIIDYFSVGELRTVPHRDALYGGISKSVEFEEEKFHVDMPGFWGNRDGYPPMFVTYSFIFHDMRQLNIINEPLKERRTGHSARMQTYEPFDDYKLYSVTSFNSVYGVFPFLHLVLLVPFLLLIFKKPTLQFNVWRLVSLWIIFPLLLVLTFSNDRIFYLLGVLD